MVEGFKNTEIGLIPIDWNLISYNDAFDFLTTATYSRAQLSENEEIGYVHYGDIHTKCLHYLDLDTINLPSIKNELLKNYPLIKDGDIIIVDASEDYAGVGKSVEVRNLKERKVISGLHTFLLRNSKETISDGFKGYINSIELVKKQMDTLATGLKVYGVSKTNLMKIQIPLPPTKAEQSAIANALNDADALITQLEKLIAKKKAIRQATVMELLTGRKRLDGFHEKWVNGELTNVCWFQEGPGLRNWQFTKSGIKVINVTNLVNGFLNLDRTARHISLDEFHKMYEHFEIDENDIVVASSGNSYGKVSVVRKQDLPLLMNTSVIRFKPLKDIDYNFLLAFLKSYLFKDQIDLLTTGGAQPNFGPAHLKKIFISLPKSPEEQKAIGEIFSNIDLEIVGLEVKLEKQKQLKQGMMQSLLTGKIRLNKQQESPQTIELKPEKSLDHNHYFEDAVLIAAIVNNFYSEKYVLGRKKVQKLLYLLRRKQEANTIAFKRKAAGPYADEVRYKGGEPIAKNKKYININSNKLGAIFSKGEQIGEALGYIEKWGMKLDIEWLCSQFKFKTIDQLELLATIDMAMCDLEKENKVVSLKSIKNLIDSDKEWKAKLEREIFSDGNIRLAIRQRFDLFEHQI